MSVSGRFSEKCTHAGKAQAVPQARRPRSGAHRKQQRCERYRGERAQVRAACRLDVHFRHAAAGAEACPGARRRPRQRCAQCCARCNETVQRRARKSARVASGRREAGPAEAQRFRNRTARQKLTCTGSRTGQRNTRAPVSTRHALAPQALLSQPQP